MNTLKLRLLAILLAITYLAPVVNAREASDSLKVLWIGNSFTYYNDLPAQVSAIAATRGIPLAHTDVLKGGERLKGHLENPRLHRLLAQGGWDFVVIQEQSSLPSYSTATVADETYPYAAIIDSLAHASSPDVKVIYYMTWAHKYGNLNPRKGYPLCDTYKGMQERLKTSYLEMAYNSDARCAPAGMAWAIVREQRPDIVMYCQDMYHPSPAGTYLNAVTLFTTMFPQHFQTDYTGGLSPSEAEYLQQVGQNTVLDNLSLLNIK